MPSGGGGGGMVAGYGTWGGSGGYPGGIHDVNGGGGPLSLGGGAGCAGWCGAGPGPATWPGGGGPTMGTPGSDPRPAGCKGTCWAAECFAHPSPRCRTGSADRATGWFQLAHSHADPDITAPSVPAYRGIPGTGSCERRAPCSGRSARSCSTCPGESRVPTRRPATGPAAGARTRSCRAAGRAGRS